MNKLVLIDGNSLINRAYYATPPLTDKKGQPTNAVFGFVNMLIKMIGDLSPKYILVAFDRKEPTFRHKMYAEYKGTRKPMPEDLRPQIPLLKEVLTAMGISIYEKPSIEADDIIGTLAKRYGGETVIITGDKDSFQLVDETTSVYFTKRGISDIDEYNYLNFFEKTGISPCQVIDLKACMGDSSDNIPGIIGVGEKTAHNLIENYKNLEGIYSHLDDFKGKLLEKIVNGKDLAFLSRELATINTFVEIPIQIEEMTFEFPFNDSVKRLFTQLDFRGFLKRSEIFATNQEEDNVETKVEVVEVNQKEQLKEILSLNNLTIVVDSNINVYAGDSKEYIIKIKETFFDNGFEFDEALNILKDYFEDENKYFICYSRKALAKTLQEFDISLKAKGDDVDIERYLVEFSGREETLKDTLYYFNLDEKTPAYSLYTLNNKLLKQIKDEGIDKLYKEIELPLTDILFDMEKTGFKVDVNVLDKLGNDYRKILNDVTDKIYSLVGETVNLNSPKQLSYVLFEKLNLTKTKKNKTGGYSTNAEALEGIIEEHPIIPLILRYRSVQKLLSTYIDGLKPLISKNGLLHTNFNQTLTQTGRLSSKEPNLQNIPVRDDEGKELRKMFIPSGEDRVLIDADYSQIELRLLAHFSGSEILINAYNNEEDIHSLTASQVFDTPISQVTSTMRRSAKAVNFGIIYGISEYGLAKNLKISPKKAAEYINKYFERYNSVKEYMDSNVEFAKQNGYVCTILNRKRVIKEISSQNYNLRSFGERAAMNMPLQGSSADIIKIAMVNVYNRLKKECPNTKLIMQVHDELILDAPIIEKEKAGKILKEEMENALKLKVPLTVEVNYGKNWYEAK